MIKILRMLNHGKDLATALFSASLIFLVYVLLQAFAVGGLQNLDLWFEILPKSNLVLLLITSFLFGVLLTLQIHTFRHHACSLKHHSISTTSSGLGALIAFIIPACPACIPLIAFILPAATALSLVTFLVKFNTELLIFSSLLMLFGIYLLGGLKEDKGDEVE